MSKKEWIRLNYSDKEAEELSKSAEVDTYKCVLKDIDDATIKLEELMKQFDITDEVIDKLCEPTGYIATAEELAKILEKEK